ncbi:MAG TPA: thiamine diphosphokinase [Ktedonobacteraceae bacterium]
MRVVIFAGGTYRPGTASQKALASADMVIAADSGAATALRLGHVPAYIVGDFDSLNAQLVEQLRARGSQIISASVEKDETDTELAVQLAIEQGATHITLLGALGGDRFDHTIANVLLLAGFDTIPIQIIDGPSTCWLLRGPGHTSIEGQVGDLLSLLPLTADANGIRTHGLYYPLNGETLRFGKPRGVSNMISGEQAEVSLEGGMLLVIHTAYEIQ